MGFRTGLGRADGNGWDQTLFETRVYLDLDFGVGGWDRGLLHTDWH